MRMVWPSDTTPTLRLASVTGYHSIRYGGGGTEETFDSILRGTVDQTSQEIWLDSLLHRSLGGQDITLTIDLPTQVAADVALGDREGAVVLMDLVSGAILAMSSHPTYDPNVRWMQVGTSCVRMRQRRCSIGPHKGSFPLAT